MKEEESEDNKKFLKFLSQDMGPKWTLKSFAEQQWIPELERRGVKVSYSTLSQLLCGIPRQEHLNWPEADKLRIEIATEILESHCRKQGKAGGAEAAQYLRNALRESTRKQAGSRAGLRSLSPGDIFPGIPRSKGTSRQHVPYLHLRSVDKYGNVGKDGQEMRLEDRIFIGRTPSDDERSGDPRIVLKGEGLHQGWIYGEYEFTRRSGEMEQCIVCYAAESGSSVSRIHAQFIRRHRKWLVRRDTEAQGDLEVRVHPPLDDLDRLVPVLRADKNISPWSKTVKGKPDDPAIEVELRDGSILKLGVKHFLVEVVDEDDGE